MAYVKSQSQDRDHYCHWPNCGKQVPPAMWGCKEHWFKLPKHLRDKIWAAYVPGQEVTLTPSQEYLEVAQEVHDWIVTLDQPIKYVRPPVCIACGGGGRSSGNHECVPCEGTGLKGGKRKPRVIRRPSEGTAPEG